MKVPFIFVFPVQCKSSLPRLGGVRPLLNTEPIALACLDRDGADRRKSSAVTAQPVLPLAESFRFDRFLACRPFPIQSQML